MSDEIIPVAEASALAPTVGEFSVAQVIARKRTIQEVMKAVMKEGPAGHYGLIPGCGDKPSLFKPGAETLAFTFQLAPMFTVERIDLPRGHREYIVTCTLTHYPTGRVIVQAGGSCSTMESKYRYRNDDKYEVTGQRIPADAKDRKAEYRKQGFGMKKVDGAWEWVKYTGSGEKTENPDPADSFNTCLKMATKRALVAAVLIGTGASDFFTQDVEDLADAAAREEAKSPKTPATEERSAASRVSSRLREPARAPEREPGSDDTYGDLPSAGGVTPATMRHELAEASKTGPEVKDAALKCGYKGRSLDTLTDDEVRRLYDAVWPKTGGAS